jgi:hypothetical protein
LPIRAPISTGIWRWLKPSWQKYNVDRRCNHSFSGAAGPTTAYVQAQRRALDRRRGFSAEGKGARGAKINATLIRSLAHRLATLLQHGRIVTAPSNQPIGFATAEDSLALAYSAEFPGKQTW